MNANFAASLAAVLRSEGGFVNDPRDPGGATDEGITQAVYDAYRRSHGLAVQSVRHIADIEVEAIYYAQYWAPIRGDDLPDGVDYCTFDFAVNSGVNRAARYLQRAVGAVEDGQIGTMTLGLVAAESAPALVERLCDMRLAYLERLPTFAYFGRGWSARVAQVSCAAKAMAA